MKTCTKHIIIAIFLSILHNPNISASEPSIIFTDEQFAFTEPPKEIWFKIFDYLDIKDLGRLAGTCKKLRILSSADGAWQNKFAEYYEGIELPDMPLLVVLSITSPKYRLIKEEIMKYQEKKNDPIKLALYPIKKKLVEHEDIITREDLEYYSKAQAFKRKTE